MKSESIKLFAEELLKTMKESLEQISLEHIEPLVRLSRSHVIVKNALTTMKDFIHSYTFKNNAEEIEFFKEIKPVFLSQYYYHQQLLSIQIEEPLGNPGSMETFYVQELHKIQQYGREHIDFQVYYLSGSTQEDEEYFLRQSQQSDPLWDARFTTKCDAILAHLLANELMKEHLLTAIKRVRVEASSSLSWTGSKTALIELAYALHSSQVFNNGQADLKMIATTFEDLFNISLGNYYRVFQDIRLRKSGRTNFLDLLKQQFTKRMEELD